MSSTPVLRTQKILIIEDQDSMRATLCDFLRFNYSDAKILLAEDGARGMQLCMEQRPQLVLMDVRLPDANGIELTARIRTLLPGTPVIVVSGHVETLYVEHARASGAYAYVIKDRIFQDLLPAINDALVTTGHETPEKHQHNCRGTS